MCTLTAQYNTQSGWRVCMTRDERRTRATEQPLQYWPQEGIVAPVDVPYDGAPQGTWIGYRGAMWAALLNGYIKVDHRATQSRGCIVPAVLQTQHDQQAIAETLTAFDLSAFAAFRLLCGVHGMVYEYDWDGQRMDVTQHDLTQGDWFMRTSSSWRQEEVQQRRRALFKQWCSEGALLLPDGVPSFHRIRLPGGDAWTPLMQRRESCSKSITLLSGTPLSGTYAPTNHNMADGYVA